MGTTATTETVTATPCPECDDLVLHATTADGRRVTLDPDLRIGGLYAPSGGSYTRRDIRLILAEHTRHAKIHGGGHMVHECEHPVSVHRYWNDTH